MSKNDILFSLVSPDRIKYITNVSSKFEAKEMYFINRYTREIFKEKLQGQYSRWNEVYEDLKIYDNSIIILLEYDFLSILKTEDEWYYVITESLRETSLKNQKVYKCDQIDGIYEFFHFFKDCYYE